jgi:hypothetical protein
VWVGVAVLIIAHGAVLDDSTVAATLRDNMVLVDTGTDCFRRHTAGAQMVAIIDSSTFKSRVAICFTEV